MNESQMTYVVVGGQFGSEGKGEVVARLAENVRRPAGKVSVVRVGGPQAGHNVTIRHETNVPGHVELQKFAMCVVPCGFHIPDSQLFIGPGSELDPDKFFGEIKMLEDGGFDVRNRVKIDPRATILTHEDKEEEQMAGMTGRLGSTAKGVGACRARRIHRLAPTVGEQAKAYGLDPFLLDNPVGAYIGRKGPLRSGLPYPGPVVVETAQGFGLSLHAAGCYPFCTSTDIVPGRALADAGISSRNPHRVVMVVRTYPIRVHGNSGPMAGEISWEELYDLSGGRSPKAGEITTVTKKVRRVCKFDWNLFDAALESIRPDMLVLTFADYLDPTIADVDYFDDVMGSEKVAEFIYKLENHAGRRVVAIATGEGVIAERSDNMFHTGLCWYKD